MSTPNAFTVMQPKYAELGIPVFPVVMTDNGKVPAIRGWQRIGLPGSAKLAEEFTDAEMLGFCLGARSKVTVLDIDTTDERVLADALSRHGETPLKVRTASRKFHLYYRHNGEGRRIRPWGDRPIDLLGGGFVVAPPSVALNRERYQIIEGTLEDMLDLPVIRGVDDLERAREIIATRPKDGERGDKLFGFCLRSAKTAKSVKEVFAMASAENETYLPPLDEGSVRRAVTSAWGYETKGKNWVGRGGMVGLAFDEVDSLKRDPDAVALLAVLRRNNSGRPNFILANSTASIFGWGTKRLRKARKRLEEFGAIRCVCSGGRGKNDPPIYRWP